MTQYKNNSIARATTIMEIIGFAGTPPKMSDICRATGLNKSTVYRFLQVLYDLGYVAADSEGRYRLSYKLFDLASVIDGPKALRVCAHDALMDLSTDIGETVHLAILEGTTVVYSDKIVAMRSVRIDTRPGEKADAHMTGLGKVLLAQLSDVELRRLYAGHAFKQRTVNTTKSFDQLVERLCATRERGHGIDNEEFDEGLKCVAVPVFGARGNVIAALSISASSSRLTSHALPGMVARGKQASAVITDRLSTIPGIIANGPVP